MFLKGSICVLVVAAIYFSFQQDAFAEEKEEYFFKVLLNFEEISTEGKVSFQTRKLDFVYLIVPIGSNFWFGYGTSFSEMNIRFAKFEERARIVSALFPYVSFSSYYFGLFSEIFDWKSCVTDLDSEDHLFLVDVRYLLVVGGNF